MYKYIHNVHTYICMYIYIQCIYIYTTINIYIISIYIPTQYVLFILYTHMFYIYTYMHNYIYIYIYTCIYIICIRIFKHQDQYCNMPCVLSSWPWHWHCTANNVLLRLFPRASTWSCPEEWWDFEPNYVKKVRKQLPRDAHPKRNWCPAKPDRRLCNPEALHANRRSATGRSRLQNAAKKHENDGLEDGLAAILIMDDDGCVLVVDFVL